MCLSGSIQVRTKTTKLSEVKVINIGIKHFAWGLLWVIEEPHAPPSLNPELMCSGYRGGITLLWSFTISISLPCESNLTYSECCFPTGSITESYWRHSLRRLWVMGFVLRPVNLMSSTSMLFFLCCKSNAMVRNCVLCVHGWWCQQKHPRQRGQNHV